MKKENILSKLNYNFKNYSEELEEILEKKAFSEEAKNLLLSMFYKIQNFYGDYKEIKIDVIESRELFIQDLIKTITEECDEIELLNPSNRKIIGKFEVDKKNKKIITFPDEVCLLYAIYDLKYRCDTKMMSPINSAVVEVLNEGYALSSSEVIRDFTGWTWISSVNENHVNTNLIYINLLILIGYENCLKLFNITEKKQINSTIRAIMHKKYGEEIATRFTDAFVNICLQIECQKDSSIKDKITEKRNKVIEKYEKMQDKARFITYITKEKKDLNGKIKDIDQLLNEPKLLEEECNKRKVNNNKLSIEDVKSLLQYERVECLRELKECNKLMDPRKYASTYEVIKNKYNLYNTFTFLDDKKTNISRHIVEFEKLFLDCLKLKIERSETKENLIDIIYEYRYYRLTKYTKDKFIKENRYLNAKHDEVVDVIIKQAKKLKVFENFTNDEKNNKNIIKELFELKTINLSNIHINILQEEDSNVIYYYDGNTLEMSKKMDKFDILVKYNKKVKVFI